MTRYEAIKGTQSIDVVAMMLYSASRGTGTISSKEDALNYLNEEFSPTQQKCIYELKRR